MGVIKIFKALLTVGEWSLVDSSWDKNTKKVTHESGMYFFSDCDAVVVYDSEGRRIKEGFFKFYLCLIPALLLQYQLKKQ